MKSTMIKGVVFDLDGTLIDSMKIWYRIDRIFLMENGISSPPDDISEKAKKMTIENSARYFIDTFGLACDVPYVIRRIEELVKKEYEENIPLKPSVCHLLDFLDGKNIPYGVATVTYKSLAEAVLKRHGIYNRLDFLITVEEYPEGKNSESMYMGCAETFGLSPENILVVEDSLHCIKTAKGAGFVTAGVYDESSKNETEIIKHTADFFFGCVAEIENIF